MDEQQLLLWRLSTAVQLVSLAMIAVFFAILARVNPRAEVTWWARAWFANLLAPVADPGLLVLPAGSAAVGNWPLYVSREGRPRAIGLRPTTRDHAD